MAIITLAVIDRSVFQTTPVLNIVKKLYIYLLAKNINIPTRPGFIIQFFISITIPVVFTTVDRFKTQTQALLIIIPHT
jgi:hypothetical protein